jgi:hypothetical protein
MTAKRMTFIFAGLAALACAAPVQSADEKKPDEKKPAEKKSETRKPDAKKSDAAEPKKDKLIPAGSLLVEVLEVHDSGNHLRVRYHAKVPDIKYNGNQAGWRPGPRPPSYTVGSKDAHEDLDILLAEDAKVRIPFQPQVDDKGKIKPESIKRDPKDPDRNLPGMKGTPKDLQRKQWVSISLGATRDKPPKYLATLVIVVGEAK